MKKARKSIPLPDRFIELYSRSRVLYPDEKGNCSAVALSILLDLEYCDVRQRLLEAGADMNIGAWKHQILSVIRGAGFNAVQVNIADIIKNYPPSKRGKQFVTFRQVARFPSAWKFEPKMLLISNTHASALVDGILIDGHNSRSVRINYVYAIRKDKT